MKVLYVGPERDNPTIRSILRRLQETGRREESVVRNEVRSLAELEDILEGIDAVVLVGRPEFVFRTEADYLGFMKAAHEQGFVAAIRFDLDNLPYRNPSYRDRYLDWIVYFDRNGNTTLTDRVVNPLDYAMRGYYQNQAMTALTGGIW